MGFADKLLTYNPVKNTYRLRKGEVEPGEGSIIRETGGTEHQIVGVRFKPNHKTQKMGMFAGQKISPEWILHLAPLYEQAGIDFKKGIFGTDEEVRRSELVQQNYSPVPQEILEAHTEAPEEIKKDVAEVVKTQKEGKPAKPGVLKRILNAIKSLFSGGKKTSYP
jgi:hypothetical protein